MSRIIRALQLDREPAPQVPPPTRPQRLLIAVIAVGFLFILASSAHGWQALIQVENLEERCDDGGRCWSTVYVGPFHTPLRVSATTGVRVGDLLELGVTCDRDACTMNVLGVKRPAP